MKKLPPTKAETALLEPFVGLPIEQIHVPRKKVEFRDATDEILATGLAGFDTESKPVFQSGVINNGPHVVQFALESKAFIFQLCHSECLAFLTELFASKELLKVGFGLSSDSRQISRKLGIKLKSAVDLGPAFRKAGYKGSIGVRAAVAVVFNQRFHKSKSTTTSNWAMAQLTPGQMLYAANDAFAALKVHMAVNSSPDLLGVETL